MSSNWRELREAGGGGDSDGDGGLDDGGSDNNGSDSRRRSRRELREAGGSGDSGGGDSNGGDSERQARRELREAGREESPAGEGDEVNGTDDPDSGDDTTRQLRPDAESDPMSEQTEPDRDPGPAREARRTLRGAGAGVGQDPMQSDPDPGREARRTLRQAGGDSGGDGLDDPDTGRRVRRTVREAGREDGGAGDDDATRPPDPADNPEVVLGGGTIAGGASGEGPARPPPEAGPGLEDTGADDPGGPRFRYEDERGTYRLSERDLARELERNFLEENPEFTDEDVRVVRRGDRFAVELTPSGRQQIEEETAAAAEEQLEEQTGRRRAQELGISPSLIDDPSVLADIEAGEDFQLVETDDGYRVETTEEFQREQAERQFEQTLEEQTGEDVTPGEDFRVVRTPGGGFEAELTDRFVGQQVETQLEEQIGRQRARSLGISPALLGDTTVLADVERGRDFTISRDDGRVSADLTEDFQEELALEFAEREIEGDTGADIDPERDLETSQAFDDRETRRFFRGDAEAPPEPSIQVSLTEAGVETVVDARQEEYGDVEIRDAGDIPVIGGAIEQWADMTGQRPVAVSDLPRDASLQTESVERGASGPGPVRTRTEQRVTGVTVDTFEEGTTVEDVLISGQRGFRQFATDVAEANLEYNPFAAAAVDAAGAFGYEDEAETVTRSAVREGVDILNPARLALTVKEAGEFVPYAARETAAGRLGISYDPAQTREAGLGQTVAAPITVEEEGLAPRAAEDVEAGVRSFADYARENPYEVGGGAIGSLIISGAVMGGAAAVSSRAGLATRALIQPGEEAAGYGGFYATRRLSGTRAANRLFPQQEPLIFSEEAAIMGARRAGSALSEGSRRVRARGSDVLLGRTEVEYETTPSETMEGFWNVERVESRPGVRSRIADVIDGGGTDRGQASLIPRGRVRGEAETEVEDPREITADDIASPLGRPRQEPLTGPRSELRQEAGEAPVNRLRDVTRAEIEPRVRPRTETRRRFETLAERNVFGFEGLEMEQLGLVDARALEIAGARSELLTETEAAQETRSEVLTEVLTETETEHRLELELELEQELESEFEQELELEFETETETELEVETDDRQQRPDDPLSSGDLGWGRTVQRELINPITGE